VPSRFNLDYTAVSYPTDQGAHSLRILAHGRFSGAAILEVSRVDSHFRRARLIAADRGDFRPLRANAG